MDFDFMFTMGKYKIFISCLFESRYSRMDQVKFVEDGKSEVIWSLPKLTISLQMF